MLIVNNKKINKKVLIFSVPKLGYKIVRVFSIDNAHRTKPAVLAKFSLIGYYFGSMSQEVGGDSRYGSALSSYIFSTFRLVGGRGEGGPAVFCVPVPPEFT
jgi:hypothetical protein